MTALFLVTRGGRFGFKVDQIGPKWDKSGAFSDQISVHLAQGPTLEINLPSLVPRERQIDEETGNTFLIQGGGFCFVF